MVLISFNKYFIFIWNILCMYHIYNCCIILYFWVK